MLNSTTQSYNMSAQYAIYERIFFCITERDMQNFAYGAAKRDVFSIFEIRFYDFLTV